MIAVWRAVGDRGRSGSALVAVMKPTDLGTATISPDGTGCTSRRRGLSLPRLW